MILPEFSSAQTFSHEVLARWLAACGDGTKIFRGCRLSGPERIRIGCYSQIDEGVLIFSGAGVVIGSHVHLAFGSSISGGGQCVIHDFVGIGASVRLLTGTDLADGSGLTNPPFLALCGACTVADLKSERMRSCSRTQSFSRM